MGSASESLESCCSSSTWAGLGEGGAGLLGRSGGFLVTGGGLFGLLAAKTQQMTQLSASATYRNCLWFRLVLALR